jgi:hypothetical protein
MAGQKRITHAGEKHHENQPFAWVAFAGLHLDATQSRDLKRIENQKN